MNDIPIDWKKGSNARDLEIEVWKEAFLEKALLLKQEEEKVKQLLLKLNEIGDPSKLLLADAISYVRGGPWVDIAHAAIAKPDENIRCIHFANGMIWSVRDGWQRYGTLKASERVPL